MEEQVQNQRYDVFLWRCGSLLAVMVLAGYMFLGPTPDNSILDDGLVFDLNQNLVHFVLALAALISAWKGSELVQKVVATIIGTLFVVAGGFAIYQADVIAPNLQFAHVSSPWEALLYIFLGLWALWVVLMPAGPVFIKDGGE